MEKTLEVGRTFDYFLSGARRDDERQEEQEVRAGYGRRRGDRKVDGFYQSLAFYSLKMFTEEWARTKAELHLQPRVVYGSAVLL